MKNLTFIFWGLWKFRLHRKGKAVGLVVENFTEGVVGEKILNRVSRLQAQGCRVYVLCAFNNAPLGVRLEDYRQVYIFQNDPACLARFCAQKHIGRLEYLDSCRVMRQAAAKFGLEVSQEK